MLAKSNISDIMKLFVLKNGFSYSCKKINQNQINIIQQLRMTRTNYYIQK